MLQIYIELKPEEPNSPTFSGVGLWFSPQQQQQQQISDGQGSVFSTEHSASSSALLHAVPIGHVGDDSGVLKATPRTAAILSDRIQVICWTE